MSIAITNTDHYSNIADSVRYSKDAAAYESSLARAKAERDSVIDGSITSIESIETYTPAQLETEVQTLAENYRGAVAEIAEDDRYFDDISTAIQGKTGQAEPYAKNEMAGAIANISTMLASNYIDLSSFEITTGANSISNTTQLYSYFNSIATSRGFQSVVAISIVGDIVFSQNLILNTAPSGGYYRYRNSSISVAPIDPQFDASIPEGTRYVIYANKKELPR